MVNNTSLRAVILTILFVLSSNAYGALPAIERHALIALYNSTDGDNWADNSGWKNPPLHTDGFALPGTESAWFGVSTSVDDLYVFAIDLEENQLSGTIPPEIGNFSNINRIDLDDNQLTGNIPPEIGNLSSMANLALSRNQLTGAIPPGYNRDVYAFILCSA